MEGIITSETIPAWWVALTMISTGILWFLTRDNRIRMDSRIFAFTMILEGLVYGILFQFFNISPEVRGFYARLMIIVLCLSQFIPLAVSFLRSVERGNQ